MALDVWWTYDTHTALERRSWNFWIICSIKVLLIDFIRNRMDSKVLACFIGATTAVCSSCWNNSCSLHRQRFTNMPLYYHRILNSQAWIKHWGKLLFYFVPVDFHCLFSCLFSHGYNFSKIIFLFLFSFHLTGDTNHVWCYRRTYNSQ